MSRFLYPRLELHEAIDAVETYIGLGTEEAAWRADERFRSIRLRFAPVGGRRVSEDRLIEIRSEIRELAAEHGYPSSRDRKGQQDFDLKTAIFLRERLEAIEGELLRDEVWRFFSCALLPDVVLWRWRDGEKLSKERFTGAVIRNAFGRLWLRAATFEDRDLLDRWALLKQLNEANLVDLLERTAFSRHRTVAREAARAFLLRRRMAESIPDLASPGQTLLRQAMLRITRIGGFSFLAALTPVELRTTLASVFNAALGALGGTVIGLRQYAPDDGILIPIDWSVDPREVPVAPSHDASVAVDEEEDDEETGDASEDGPESLRFEDLEPDEQVFRLWTILLGEGIEREEQLIRRAAVRLREEGLIAFTRFHEGGRVYSLLQDAMNRGRRAGLFDVPRRGYRRAVLRSPEKVTPDLVFRVMQQAGIDPGELDAPKLAELVEAQLRELVDLPRLRPSQRAVLENAIACAVAARSKEVANAARSMRAGGASRD